MSNRITAYFRGRVGVTEAVYQNDYGIVMNFDDIDLPAHFDCYFSTPGEDEAVPAIGADNMVQIPNAILARSGRAELHIPIHSGANDSEVEYIVHFKVIGRARPVDDGTPVQMTAIEQALALLQNPIGNIEQIVNEALAFTGDTFAEMQAQLDADQAAFKTEVRGDIADVESDFDNLNAQFQTAVSAVTVDSEVQNVRVGADNVTYASAGEAVRTQFTNLKSDLDTMSVETGRNLLNERELLNITDSSYANGWYSFVPNNVSTLYGPEAGKASFPHRTFKENTQYTLSFDGAYTGTVSSTYIIGFKYTDGTDSFVAVWGSDEDHYKLTSTANKTIARVYFDWNYNVTSRIKNLMMVEGTTEPTEFIPYGERTAVDDGAREQITTLREHNTLSELMNFEQGENIYNSYDLIHYKWIYPTDGSIEDSEYYEVAYSPTYIPVTEGETLTATERMFIAFYDDEYNVVSALQMGTDKQTTVPTGAKFVRLSCSSTDHSMVKVVKGTSIGASVGRYSFSIKGLETDDNEMVIVDANGGGDYTSFTEAVYNNVDNGKTIIVNAGTYDIKAEYIALFGQSVVDNLSDSTIGINNFQYGVRIHDRKIVFESGSHIVCDWTGKTIDENHRFCTLRVEPNAELIGLDLDCTATFYCIHDDYGTEDDSPFTIKYENCRVIGHNLYNANCIGGGAHKYSRHILNNCYFKNNVSSSDRVLSADVRYHNTNTAEAEPELYVSNCYFSNNMNVTYYGTQTTKFRAYVNNCLAPYGIIKRAESSSMSVDNVELYTWNNQTN